MNIDEIVKVVSETPSDINEHILTLKRYAEKCEHITELGVRAPVSTWAFVAAKPKVLRSYDIKHPDEFMSNNSVANLSLKDVENTCSTLDIDFKFHLADVLTIEIEQTDLLFIDTQHNFYQISQELALHANKANKYIIFHDVITWGTRGELYGHPNLVIPGILPAIKHFLENNPNWSIVEVFENNNGLLIIERKD
jgi:hypothetical protein